MADAPLLKVKIINPAATLFEGDALSVSSKNSLGKFDVLPEHANFITLVEKEPIIIRKPDKETTNFEFDLAIVYVSNNKVNVYTDIQLTFTAT